jgi:hypothetical protein
MSLKSIFNKIIKKYQICRVEAIDIENYTVELCCRGMETNIKLKLQDIACDKAILSNLIPMQAATLGYYYGNMYLKKKQLKQAIQTNKEPNPYGFVMEDCIANRYNIICFTRDGSLVFVDKKTGKEFASPPRQVLAQKEIVKELHSSQAFYIGFIATAGIMRN